MHLHVSLLAALCLPVLLCAAPRAVFLTYVSNPVQERSAAILLESVHRFGGPLAAVPFHVAQVNPSAWSPVRLVAAGAHLIPVAPAPDGRAYPFLQKVLAIAAAEAHLKNEPTVIYLDAESVVLGDLSALIPAPGHRLAIRPVHLANQIGVPAAAPLDLYWQSIYRQLGSQPADGLSVRSLVDQRDLRPYYSCVSFGFIPSLGLMARWRDALLALVADDAFQKSACVDALHRIFLHQAVLSALVTLELQSGQIQTFPPVASYPVALHDRVPAGQRPASLDELRCIYVDTLWRSAAGWWRPLGGRLEVATFLSRAELEWRQLRDGLSWEPGAANTYLITTPEGNVMVDPGGAGPESPLHRVPGAVKTIVFTHSHTDHTAGSAAWHRPGVPVVAQQEWQTVRDYQTRLSGFFARRDAAQGNVLVRPAADPWPSVSFRDHRSFTLGGRVFEATHAPGETPDHLLLWVPHLRAVFVGDNVFGAFPNLGPPRGSLPRWPLDWIASLDKIVALEPEILCAGHMDPLFGKENIQTTVRRLRDAIAYVHDATVAGMNQGKTLPELLRDVRLPAALALPEAYARVGWAVRAIYQSYGGWFDENPATLFDQVPTDVAPDLVELAGGAGPLLRRARGHLSAGRPLQALHLLDMLLAALPADEAARLARVEALQALAAQSSTYLERRWLQHAIERSRGRTSQ